MSTMIQFRRGSYTFFSEHIALLEAQPYEAGVIEPDGTVFETLWLGGHDGVNKLVGGGFQLTTGQPSFAAPAGAAKVDLGTSILWASNGTSWQALTGGSSPPPAATMIIPPYGTIDGGKWT